MKVSSILPLSSAIGLSLFVPLSGEAVDFQKDVRPILNSKCFKCHTGPRAKGKLRMDSEAEFSKRIAGEDPVIVPGNPAESLLAIKAGLPRSNGDAMPPPPARERGAEAMTTSELDIVKQWIAEGASFDEGGSTTAPTVTSTDTPADAPAEAGAMKDEMHTWSNFEGNTLKAVFLGAEGTTVLLRLEDGKEISYDYNKLSPESQELARKLATQ